MTMVTEDEMRRLAFARHLYNMGVEQSHRPQPFSAVAILHFHDAVELFLHMGAEKFGENTKNIEFMQYWDTIEPHLSGRPLAERESMRRLNMMRVNLKHHNNYPAPLSIEGFRASVASFFEVNTPLVFDIEFAAVSLLSLVRFDNTRDSLSEAESLMQNGQYQEVMECIALAFHRLVRDYSNRTRELLGRSWVDLGGIPSIRGAFSRGEKDPRLAQLTNELVELAEVVKNLRDVVRSLSLGLDNRAYQRFQSLAPRVIEAFGGGIRFAPKRKEPPTADECHFCLDFVIESALHLQEFDF